MQVKQMFLVCFLCVCTVYLNTQETLNIHLTYTVSTYISPTGNWCSYLYCAEHTKPGCQSLNSIKVHYVEKGFGYERIEFEYQNIYGNVTCSAMRCCGSYIGLGVCAYNLKKIAKQIQKL